MKLSNVVLSKNVEKIGMRAFRYTNIKTLDLPHSLRYIEDHAFLACDKITNIIIPDSVVSIGVGAFAECIYNHRTTKTNQKYPSVNL